MLPDVSMTIAATMTASHMAHSFLAANAMVDTSGVVAITVPVMPSITRALATAAVTASVARSPPISTPTLPEIAAFLTGAGVGLGGATVWLRVGEGGAGGSSPQAWKALDPAGAGFLANVKSGGILKYRTLCCY